MEYMEYIIIALSLVNIAGFILAGTDKYRAGKRRWRIPERIFFILAILGGCPGVYAGLLIFRHKTRHMSFMLGIPVIFLIQLAIIVLSCYI